MSGSNRRAKKPPTKNVIDVDDFHKRYEDTDDLVQCSSAQEFRKAWRSAHKEKVVERTRSRSIGESSPSRQSRGQQSDSSRPISTSIAGNVGVVATGGQHHNTRLQRVRQQMNKSAVKEGRSMSREAVQDDIDLPSTLGPSIQRARVVSISPFSFVE